MKKILLALLVNIGLFSSAYATHLMGGEIIATQIVDSTYEIRLTVYRDTLGIPMDQKANFEVRDSAGTVLFSFQTPQDTSLSGALLPLYPYGVEVYVFIDTITLPGSGMYHISFNDCCRNGAIQNMTKPLSESMHLTTTVTAFDTTANSTPFFLVRPVIFLPLNTSWSYNPLPFDPNGDSLVYSVDTPLTAHQTNVTGFTTPPGTSTGGFTIDPATSTISWTASTLGNFDATVLTEEYRNGVKIGEIRRDMQFIVVNPTSTIPRVTNMNKVPTNSKGNYHVGLVANERYEFSFYADDPDTADVVMLEAFGEPFLFNQNMAKFTTRKTGKSYGNEIEGTIVWTPNEDMVRTKPYLIVYRASDGLFANDETVLYSVYAKTNTTTSIQEIDESNGFGNLYPNPASNMINIPVKFDRSKQLVGSIYNIQGTLVHEMNRILVPKGQSIISTQFDLSPGNYIMVLQEGNSLIFNEQFTVVE